MKKLDIDSLKMYLDCDDDFLATLMASFLEESKDIMAKLRRAYEENDREMLRMMAHKMQSCSRIFGLDNLTGLLEKIESNSVKKQNDKQISDWVIQLEREKEEVFEGMENEMRKLKVKIKNQKTV